MAKTPKKISGFEEFIRRLEGTMWRGVLKTHERDEIIAFLNTAYGKYSQQRMYVDTMLAETDRNTGLISGFFKQRGQRLWIGFRQLSGGTLRLFLGGILRGAKGGFKVIFGGFWDIGVLAKMVWDMARKKEEGTEFSSTFVDGFRDIGRSILDFLRSGTSFLDGAYNFIIGSIFNPKGSYLPVSVFLEKLHKKYTAFVDWLLPSISKKLSNAETEAAERDEQMDTTSRHSLSRPELKSRSGTRSEVHPASEDKVKPAGRTVRFSSKVERYSDAEKTQSEEEGPPKSSPPNSSNRGSTSTP